MIGYHFQLCTVHFPISVQNNFSKHFSSWYKIFVDISFIFSTIKNWKILLLYLSSFYLLEPFASKESIPIIILIFFYADLNFFHVKVAPLKIILINICVHVLCRMGQPLFSSIITFFSKYCYSIQSHMPNNPKWGKQPPKQTKK